MPASHTKNGKAFEYSCLNALREKLRTEGKDIDIEDNSSYNKAKNFYYELPEEDRSNLDKAAKTAVRLLLPLEPRILNGSGVLLLGINSDSAAIGVDGDVRDVLCIRNNDNWEIGLSCKHNHEALKHPRITGEKDFGRDWIGYNCSREFIDEISTVIDQLTEYGEEGRLWRTIENKHDNFYVPILQAYLDELVRLCAAHEDAPTKLLSYFFGSRDFYKVISKEKNKTTEIEGFNMNGTLNAPAGQIRPITRIATLRMPTRLIEARFKEGSKTTIILTFDGGWSVTMRLHNKDKVAKPTSLAWNVELEGLPTGTYVNISPWED